MLDQDIAEAFRAIFATDPAFSGRAQLNDLSTTLFTLPCEIFAATTKPLNASGTASTYTLTVTVCSPAENRDGETSELSPEARHSIAIEAVRDKLLGTGRASVMAALAAHPTVNFRGLSYGESTPALESNHFRTALTASGIVLLTA